MKKILLTAACAIGFAALTQAITLPDVYLRGSMSNWGVDESTKFTYNGDINNPVPNQSGEYEFSLQMKILVGEFKLADSNWGPFNYGAQEEYPYITGNCTKQAWSGSSVNFTFDSDDKALTDVTLTFYYLPNPNRPSWLKIEGTEVSRASITVAAPTLSIAGGAVYDGTTVVLSTATEGATIYYTTDDTEPGASSTEYTGAITINDAMTIKAIAVKQDMLDSEVITASYTMLDPNIPIDPAATSAVFDFNNASGLTPAVTAPSESAPSTDLSSKFFKNNVVTFAISGNEGSSDLPCLWWDGVNGIDMRLYAPQSFTVSVPEGYILGDILFEHYGSENLAGLSSSVGTYAVNSDDTKKATWTCRMGEDQPYSTVENVTFTANAATFIQRITVNYTAGTPTGVGNIAVEDENAPAEYYNLQGVRVTNPGPGLYIVRRGNTASKTLLR